MKYIILFVISFLLLACCDTHTCYTDTSIELFISTNFPYQVCDEITGNYIVNDYQYISYESYIDSVQLTITWLPYYLDDKLLQTHYFVLNAYPSRERFVYSDIDFTKNRDITITIYK